MPISLYYVDPVGGNDTTGDGSLALPKQTFEAGLALCLNTTDGDQLNIKSGGTCVLVAAMTIPRTLTQAAPLIIAGYTSVADDGGIGVLSGGGSVAILAGTTNDYINFRDLRLTNTGANGIVSLRNYSSVINCEVDTCANIGISANGNARILSNHVHDCTGNYAIYSSGSGEIAFNHVRAFQDAPSKYGIGAIGVGCQIIGNVVRTPTRATGILIGANGVQARGNSVAGTSGTAAGIRVDNNLTGLHISNNIMAGFSGSGGIGLAFTDAKATLVVYHSNAFYGNTTNISGAPKLALLAGNNDVLAAAPWVDPANGDFDINGTVTGVTEDAWPSSFPGLASTSPKQDKGAVQAGGGGGSPDYPAYAYAQQ